MNVQTPLPPSRPAYDLASIMHVLPHRPPFLLIDKVLDVVRGVSGTGVKQVTAAEPFFQGHFPGNPTPPMTGSC